MSSRVFLMVSCFSIASLIGHAKSSAAETHEVVNSGMTFSPATMTIAIGDTVHWTVNSAHTIHSTADDTCTSPTNDFYSGQPGTFGGSFSHEFGTTGVFHYKCDIHCAMGMKGVITVLPGSTTAITSTSPDNPASGDPVTVHFTVTATGGTPTGNVTISDGTDSCTADVSAGQCDVTFSSGGTKQITASYDGDSSFAPSHSAESSLIVSGPPGNDNSNDNNNNNNSNGGGTSCGNCGYGAATMMPLMLAIFFWRGTRRALRSGTSRD